MDATVAPERNGLANSETFKFGIADQFSQCFSTFPNLTCLSTASPRSAGQFACFLPSSMFRPQPNCANSPLDQSQAGPARKVFGFPSVADYYKSRAPSGSLSRARDVRWPIPGPPVTEGPKGPDQDASSGQRLQHPRAPGPILPSVPSLVSTLFEFKGISIQEPPSRRIYIAFHPNGFLQTLIFMRFRIFFCLRGGLEITRAIFQVWSLS